MLPEIIADENIDISVVKFLRNNKVKVYSILENESGVPDSKILEIANSKKGIILTEDKDFGEWIFSHHNNSSGVIFLRYQFLEKDLIKDSLFKIITKYNDQLFGKFTGITVKKVRMRDI